MRKLWDITFTSVMSSKKEEKHDIVCPHCGKEKLRQHATFPNLQVCPAPWDGYYQNEFVKGCGYIYEEGEYKKPLFTPCQGNVDLR